MLFTARKLTERKIQINRKRYLMVFFSKSCMTPLNDCAVPRYYFKDLNFNISLFLGFMLFWGLNVDALLLCFCWKIQEGPGVGHYLNIAPLGIEILFGSLQWCHYAQCSSQWTPESKCSFRNSKKVNCCRIKPDYSVTFLGTY